MNLIGTLVVYAGLLGTLFGAVSIVWPLRFLGIASRSRGILFLFSGVVISVIGASLPAGETRIAMPRTHLDDFAPVYQFSEFHSVRVKAPPQKVFKAIQEVKVREIFLFRTLAWVRRFGRSGPESILNAAPDVEILAVATRTGFLNLAEEPNREVVFGTLVAAPPGWRRKGEPTPEKFKELHAPGFAVAAMSFRIADGVNGETLVTTETRVYATDASVRRKFSAYWRVIYPGSALIRLMWLRAIKHRAEKMPG